MNRVWSTVLIGISVGAGGCAETSGANRTRVSSADFVETAERTPEPAPAAQPEFVMSVEEARRGVVDIQASPGAPPVPTDEPERDGPPILVDAKVGDIHGKPIYANEFFTGNQFQAGVGRRLDALADQVPLNEWLKEATEIISQQLRVMLENQLVVAEARSSLPKQVRQGLFSFVERFRDDQESQNRGSAIQAEQAAQDSEGLNLDQLAENQLEQSLIRFEISRKVEAQIHVTKHDQEIEWERNWIRYNPPPTATIWRIYIDSSETETIEDITTRLEAGEPFEEVARIELNTALDDGRWLKTFAHTRDNPYTSDMFRITTFIRVEALNTAIQSLKPGQWVGPIEHAARGRMVWFSLEGVENLPRSYYDTQQIVYNYLKSQQRIKKQTKYMNKLFSRSSYTDFDEMVDRLLKIAAARYNPDALELLTD